MIIGICNFDIVCNLNIVIWDFRAVSGKVNRFYRHQLGLTLTFPWVPPDFYLSIVISLDILQNFIFYNVSFYQINVLK